MLSTDCVTQILSSNCSHPNVCSNPAAKCFPSTTKIQHGIVFIAREFNFCRPHFRSRILSQGRNLRLLLPTLKSTGRKSCLVNFDTHGDLAANDWIIQENPTLGQIHGSTSIASWILAAVQYGMVDRVVWIQPPWAEEMEPGTQLHCFILYNCTVKSSKSCHLTFLTQMCHKKSLTQMLSSK
jgi:hypothetical protein